MRGLTSMAVMAVLLTAMMGCQADECCGQESQLDGYFTPADDPAETPPAESPLEQAAAAPQSSTCEGGYCAPTRYARESVYKRYRAWRRGPVRSFFARVFRR